MGKNTCCNDKKVVPLHPQKAYCAGSKAINTLKESDLAFNCEEASVSF